LSGYVRLSPDAKRIATWISRPTNGDVFLMDAETGFSERFTFGPTWEWSPVWSPDGERIAYSSARPGHSLLFVRDVDGGDEPSLLYEGSNTLWPTSWSPDSKWLAFDDAAPGNRQDVLMVDLTDPSIVDTVAATTNWECCGHFSPGGGLLAYQSDEAGVDEIYVVSMPTLGNIQLVSDSGGVEPRWIRETGELVYLQGEQLMLGGVEENGSFRRVVPPELLVDLTGWFAAAERHYWPAPDGQRFLVQTRNPESPATEIHVVLNWFEAVLQAEARAGGG
jgi:Tol biopolymer transport system component